MAIPRQWKLIALYMVLAYLAFVVAINIAKHEVAEEERAGIAAPTPSG